MRRDIFRTLASLVILGAVLLPLTGMHARADSPGEDLEAIEARLDAALRAARQGRAHEGAREAFQAFMKFESSSLHGTLKAENSALYGQLEAGYMAFREAIRRGRPTARVQQLHADVLQLHDRAREALESNEGAGSFYTVFASSFMIIFREGLEAILVIAAMLAYLARVGATDQRRSLFAGAAGAIVLSLLLAGAARWLFTLGAVQREILEGATMLLATLVLFYVSYWLISKVRGERWKQYIESRIDASLNRGSSLMLALVAFVVVFREGFETVLFYQALAFSSGASLLGGGGLMGGFLVGVVVLGGVGYGIVRSSVRLPLKPFFLVTSAFLYFLAFKFAGDGIAELQEAGVVPVDYLSFVPRLSWLQAWFGIYPSLQPLLLQSVLVILLVVAVAYSFAPRRLSVPR